MDPWAVVQPDRLNEERASASPQSGTSGEVEDEAGSGARQPALDLVDHKLVVGPLQPLLKRRLGFGLTGSLPCRNGSAFGSRPGAGTGLERSFYCSASAPFDMFAAPEPPWAGILSPDPAANPVPTVGATFGAGLVPAAGAVPAAVPVPAAAASPTLWAPAAPAMTRLKVTTTA